ncbi:MAG: hypothetical protein GX884_02070 [Chloroflexi bacterium]|jgi:hypothetical protein|nr:hypothetical protein [Chloroflexota bacterium]
MKEKFKLSLITENDRAWYRFFENRDFFEQLITNKEIIVSSTELKKFGEREPRLMAKIDTREELPSIFRKFNISLLPIQNKQYLLFIDDSKSLFYEFPTLHAPVITKFANTAVLNLETLQERHISSESKALDFAYIASILKTFTGENNLWLTIRGRQYSNKFDLIIPALDRSHTISSTQIEVDAGYESDDSIYLVEAKMGSRSNFNVRQLLFPYLNWASKTKKRVVPVFFTFSNGIYTLHEFKFSNILGDTNIIRSSSYALADSEITFQNLTEVFKQCPENEIHNPRVPFPQANDINKVIDTVTVIDQGINSKNELAGHFEFDPRQADYYANAAMFLGFIKRGDEVFELTEIGKELAQETSRAQRVLKIFNRMSKIRVLRPIIQQFLSNGMDEQSIDYSSFIRNLEEFYSLRKTTPQRRISTVKTWLIWIKEGLS